ncbi:MAG: hypothetical protein O9295_27870 [Microcystis sp. LE18-22.4A]|nr:hypothetical protein [Microcystis sp. LE18-22.4A]
MAFIYSPPTPHTPHPTPHTPHPNPNKKFSLKAFKQSLTLMCYNF